MRAPKALLSPLLTRLNPFKSPLGTAVLSVLLLAGCASQGPNQSAELNELLSDLRSDYAYRTQSDPLGAYLANRGLTDRTFSYARDELGRGTHSMAGEALNLLGGKYTFGGEDPSSSCDCSGLVGELADQDMGPEVRR